MENQTARVEAFSDGVFAIAITLLILEIVVRAPHEAVGNAELRAQLVHLWPSYLAYIASFITIGVMWLNHHRLFTLIVKNDDGMIAWNLVLLLGVTWVPFPTAVLAAQLLAPSHRIAAVMYSVSFFGLAIVFNLSWRYIVRSKLVKQHVDVPAITRQYAAGPVLYGLLIIVGAVSAVACLVLSVLIAVYFLLPPRLWRRTAST
jgi:TMEM175 potassium channel family protein